MVPCVGSVVLVNVTTWPSSGSVAWIAPDTGTFTAVESSVSFMLGGWFTGAAGTTSVLTAAALLVPSLLVGSGSDDVEVDDTTSRSVPDAGAVPVTVNVRVSPEGIEPTSQVTLVAVTTPPAEAVTPASAAGKSSRTTTSDAIAGPAFRV